MLRTEEMDEMDGVDGMEGVGYWLDPGHAECGEWEFILKSREPFALIACAVGGMQDTSGW